MSRLYVYQKIEKLVRRHGTRDPFELLDAMHVQVRFYFDLHSTKGFSRYFLRQYFVGINGNLPEEDQRIVGIRYRRSRQYGDDPLWREPVQACL